MHATLKSLRTLGDPKTESKVDKIICTVTAYSKVIKGHEGGRG